LKGLPPLLIQVGSYEVLLDDSINLARLAALANVQVTLEVWPEMAHVWHMFHPWIEEGTKALQAGGRFVRGLIPDS
jgi:acetyl esterase/lipase